MQPGSSKSVSLGFLPCDSPPHIPNILLMSLSALTTTISQESLYLYLYLYLYVYIYYRSKPKSKRMAWDREGLGGGLAAMEACDSHSGHGQYSGLEIYRTIVPERILDITSERLLNQVRELGLTKAAVCTWDQWNDSKGRTQTPSIDAQF